METKEISITFTKIKKDVNGNSRIVCHHSNIVNEKDLDFPSRDKDGKIVLSTDEIIYMLYKCTKKEHAYNLALKRAKKIGGKKYNTKDFPNCIVFQSTDPEQTERDILSVKY